MKEVSKKDFNFLRTFLRLFVLKVSGNLPRLCSKLKSHKEMPLLGMEEINV